VKEEATGDKREGHGASAFQGRTKRSNDAAKQASSKQQGKGEEAA
jgi:hypothetical protein